MRQGRYGIRVPSRSKAVGNVEFAHPVCKQVYLVERNERPDMCAAPYKRTRATPLADWQRPSFWPPVFYGKTPPKHPVQPRDYICQPRAPQWARVRCRARNQAKCPLHLLFWVLQCRYTPGTFSSLYTHLVDVWLRLAIKYHRTAVPYTTVYLAYIIITSCLSCSSWSCSNVRGNDKKKTNKKTKNEHNRIGRAKQHGLLVAGLPYTGI